MIGQGQVHGNSIRQTIQLKLYLPRLFFQGLQYDPWEAGRCESARLDNVLQFLHFWDVGALHRDSCTAIPHDPLVKGGAERRFRSLKSEQVESHYVFRVFENTS